jgi:hypothetical protein
MSPKKTTSNVRDATDSSCTQRFVRAGSEGPCIGRRPRQGFPRWG